MIAFAVALALLLTLTLALGHSIGYDQGKAVGEARKQRRCTEAISRRLGPAAAVAVAFELEEMEAAERTGAN